MITCCFDVGLWIDILAAELEKREAESPTTFCKTFSIGDGCSRHGANDAHIWDANNQNLSAQNYASFAKVDDFMLAHAANADDYEMELPLVCRQCRNVDVFHSDNFCRTRFVQRENECEHCHALFGCQMARVCFGSGKCSDGFGRLCHCMQPDSNDHEDEAEEPDPHSFPQMRSQDRCGIVCATCLPLVVCPSCHHFYSMFCADHECATAGHPQERPDDYYDY